MRWMLAKTQCRSNLDGKDFLQHSLLSVRNSYIAATRSSFCLPTGVQFTGRSLGINGSGLRVQRY